MSTFHPDEKALRELRDLVRSVRQDEPVAPERLVAKCNQLVGSLNGSMHHKYASVLISVAAVLKDINWTKDAVPFLENALAIARHNGNDRQTLKAARLLAIALQRVGFGKQAEGVLESVLPVARKRESRSAVMRLEKALERMHDGGRFPEQLISPSGSPIQSRRQNAAHISAVAKKGPPPQTVKADPSADYPAEPGRFTPCTTVKLETMRDPSAAGFRVQIATWLRNYPEEHFDTFAARLWSRDESVHLSAFYELLFLQYCIGRGWSVEVEPTIGGGRPDFRVAAPSGEFLLEVGTFADANGNTDRVKLIESFLACLDGVGDDQLLSVQFHDVPSAARILAVRDQAELWLSQVKRREVFPQLAAGESETVATITAEPRWRIESTGAVYEWGLPPAKGEIGESAHLVSKALDKDRKFMSGWNGPLVIAACTRENAVLDETSLCASLFGQASIDVRRDGSIAVRCDRQGAGFGPYNNGSVSALMFCTRRWDLCRVVYDMRIIHNPWARRPLPPEVFAGHRQLVPVRELDAASGTACGPALEWLDWSKLTVGLLR